MISKAQKKYIKSLGLKKKRHQKQEFVVEGNKSIKDFIKNGYIPRRIYSTTPQEWEMDVPLEEISKKELQSISFLTHPKDSLAIFNFKNNKAPEINRPILLLDNIQDPGNLGTIIRTADWFGIKDIICTTNTVDCYSPKVVQASMGSLANTHLHYTDLKGFIKEYPHSVYGTFMDGNNALQESFPDKFALVIGNEGNGISPEIEKTITHKITIPKHPQASAESLNAAIANAIILSKIFT